MSPMINDLMDLAWPKRTMQAGLSPWFLQRTVEERLMPKIVKKLEMIGESRHGMSMLDKELGKEAD